MRVLIASIAILLSLSAAAQDSEFPTLDALEQLEIPVLDYADMLSRLSAFNPSFSLPTEPQEYQIGDRWTFTVPANDIGEQTAADTELRGLTGRVLIWVEDSAAYSRSQAQALAERVARKVVLPLQEVFDSVEPPGIDADPRLTIVMIDNPDFSKTGIFPRGHAMPRALSQRSNQREMMLINIAHEDRVEINEELMDEVIAHEYQHILLHHRDFDEEHWLNEALSGFAEHYTSGAGSGYDSVYWLADMFLAAPNTGLMHLYSVDDVSAKYGAGALFTIYLAQQYGNQILAELYADDLPAGAAWTRCCAKAPAFSPMTFSRIGYLRIITWTPIAGMAIESWTSFRFRRSRRRHSAASPPRIADGCPNTARIISR